METSRRGYMSRTSLISVRTGWRSCATDIICCTVRGVTREGQSPCNSPVCDEAAHRGDSPCVSQESPIIINSGFRSPDTNQLCGGATHSNHLTGCAVDIHCMGKEQAIRYACILLDIADGKKLDFDELILEKRGTTIWVHFAVRPKGNRRYVDF